MRRTSSRRLRRYLWAQKIKIPMVNFKSWSFWAWIASFGYGAIGIVIIFGHYLRVHQASCITNQQISCPDFVIPELEKLKNHSIVWLDTKNIEARLLSNIPNASTIRVFSKWPDELVASIEWQTPFVQLKVPTNSSYLFIGENAKIIASDTSAIDVLPTIEASTAADLLISDSITDPSLLASFDIIKTLSTSTLKVDRISIYTPEDIRVSLTNGIMAQFSSTKPVIDQVLKLHLLIAQTTISTPFTIIDVRLERPVLR